MYHFNLINMMRVFLLISLIVLANANPHNKEFEVEFVGCSSATDLIKKHEGYRSCEYKDTKGHPTICYGFNLDRQDAKSKIESVGGDFEKVYKGGCLSKGQCNTLLEGDIKVAEGDEAAIFGSVCTCVKAVLIDLTYNLGYPQMKGFGTFISLIKAKSWKSAGEDLKRTPWCSQVGGRCQDDVTQIENGCVENEILAEFEDNSYVEILIKF